MNPATQSASTLMEMLREAAVRVACSPSRSAQDLASRIDELRRSIGEETRVSAEAEQEIVSIYVLAELAEERPPVRFH